MVRPHLPLNALRAFEAAARQPAEKRHTETLFQHLHMVADGRLREPGDLAREMLLRSYRSDEWPRWFAAAGVTASAVKGPVFDSSWTMVEAAAQGLGVALAPPVMFRRQLATGLVRQPFEVEVTLGSYWLTWLKSKAMTTALRAFRAWITAAIRLG